MIWFDFENAPHILFWRPVMEHLKERSIDFIVTARDFSYTRNMLQDADYEYYLCKEGGKKKSTSSKYLSVVKRGLELYRFIKGKDVVIACSFGSRAQIIASKLRGIPVISTEDYEYANMIHAKFTKYTLIPSVIPKNRIKIPQRKLIHYDGYKEDMYIADYQPKEIDIKINNSKVVVLFRPGDYYSHYQSEKYQAIEKGLLELFKKQREEIFLMVFPRHQEQKNYLTGYLDSHDIENEFPRTNYFGPDLIWQSDMVIGGGGTMLREACALNVPAYSFFSGKTGGVDEDYVRQGKMSLILAAGDLQNIRFVKCTTKSIRRNTKVFEAFRDIITNEIEINAQRQ
jgi:predicted glycosyltransferase